MDGDRVRETLNLEDKYMAWNWIPAIIMHAGGFIVSSTNKHLYIGQNQNHPENWMIGIVMGMAQSQLQITRYYAFLLVRLADWLTFDTKLLVNEILF